MSSFGSETKNAYYTGYGKVKAVPTRRAELDNDTKPGKVTVDGIIIKEFGDYIFTSLVCGDVIVDLKAGYVATTLREVAPVMEYPFEMQYKKKDGKMVVV